MQNINVIYKPVFIQEIQKFMNTDIEQGIRRDYGKVVESPPKSNAKINNQNSPP